MDDLTEIKNQNGKVIFSNIPDPCQICMQDCDKISEKIICTTLNEERRRGKIKNKNGSIYFCTNDSDHLKSSRIFKSRVIGLSKSLESTLELHQNIKEEKNQDVRRLMHNLTSLNAHTIQELYNLVPQERITDDWKSQINLIEAYIQKNPTESAKAFLRVVKNVMAMKTEFSVFKILFDENYSTKVKSHPIRKVILNVYHTFFQDFKDKSMSFRISNNNTHILIDYESFRVALYHIFQNAIKYCLEGSALNVVFKETGEHFSIVFEMVSMKILDDEVDKIFQENFSGYYPKKGDLNGDGIGLYTSKKLLNLNNSELLVSVSPRPNEIELDGIMYVNNQFIIQVNKQFDTGKVNDFDS